MRIDFFSQKPFNGENILIKIFSRFMTFDLKVKHLLENVLWRYVVCNLSRFFISKSRFNLRAPFDIVYQTNYVI